VKNRLLKMFMIGLFLTCVSAGYALGQEAETGKAPSELEVLQSTLQDNLNVVWTCVAAFLVFFMQAGFAMVEAGFTRAKNAVNIIMKNLMDFSIGTLAFFLVGFGLMFGTTNGFFGTTDFAITNILGDGEHWNYTFLIFQTVFAGTAATIVSGAMAGRTKFTGYICYSVFICALIYPVFGSWAWGSLLNGNGWLEKLGFCDFAGSTVVHSVGGWVAGVGGCDCSGTSDREIRSGRKTPGDSGT